MGNTARSLPRMTIAAFFALKGEEGVRYELIDGVPVRAMTGASRRHDLILVNALTSLHVQLKGKPCRASTDDIAVVVPNGNVRRPDLSVDCGRLDDRDMRVDAPRLVMEVLSPSTRGLDLVRKLEEYKSVPGLAYILIVEPEAPRALLWRREGGAPRPWVLEEAAGLDGAFDLPAIAARLTLAELYERVTFDPHGAGAGMAPEAPTG